MRDEKGIKLGKLIYFKAVAEKGMVEEFCKLKTLEGMCYTRLYL